MSPSGKESLFARPGAGRKKTAFADAVARELLPHVRHPDDFTLLVVELAGG